MTDTALWYESTASTQRGMPAGDAAAGGSALTAYPYVEISHLLPYELIGIYASNLGAQPHLRAAETIATYDSRAITAAFIDLTRLRSFAVSLNELAYNWSAHLSEAVTDLSIAWPSVGQPNWSLAGRASRLQNLGAVRLDEFPTAYSAPDWPFVARFVSAHPALLGPLAELPGEVRRAFSAQETLELSPFVDPEDGAERLVASIWTALDPADALTRLDVLDSEWWLAWAPKAGGLIVNLEYR